jgi:methionine synthase II (cobalamin-independent)
MLGATKDKKLVTTVTGSFPRPSWFTHNLNGRPFRVAMGETAYREQYLDALAFTSDCGFGREGLSRRIAHYKCVSLVEGTNIVRRELGLPEVLIRAADPKFSL